MLFIVCQSTGGSPAGGRRVREKPMGFRRRPQWRKTRKRKTRRRNHTYTDRMREVSWFRFCRIRCQTYSVIKRSFQILFSDPFCLQHHAENYGRKFERGVCLGAWFYSTCQKDSLWCRCAFWDALRCSKSNECSKRTDAFRSKFPVLLWKLWSGRNTTM